MSETKEIDVLKQFAQKALGLEPDQYAELVFTKSDEENAEPIFKDTALDDLLEANALKIKTIKDSTQEQFDKGYSKGKAETMKTFENQLKEELDFKSDLKGVELVKAYAESIRKEKPDKPTDDQVKKHPLYIELEQKAQKEKEEAVQAVKDEYEDFKTNVTKKEKMSAVNSKAWNIVAQLNPVIDGLPGENQKKSFFNALGIYDYEENNGTFIVTDPNKNNERVEDSQGNAKKFEALVTEKAQEFFVFSKQSGQSSSGNNNDKTPNFDAIEIKSEEDFKTLMKNAAGNQELEAKISAAYRDFLGK